MGNCLKCFKTSSQNSNTSNAGCTTTGIIGGLHQSNERGELVERGETDELLTSSPNHLTNIDQRSGSFKNKSLLIINGNPNNMSDLLTSATAMCGGVGGAGAGGAFGGLYQHPQHHHLQLQFNKDTQHQVSDNTLNALFEEYKDPNEDAILPEGIERLCCDLGYKPDDFAILVLAWRLDASQMCRFTKTEFIHGLQDMNADTIDCIKMRLEQIIEKMKNDSELFKQLYRFTFKFGLEPMLRILSLEMAIILWRLVFTIHKPDILDRWLHFLEQHPNIRGIPKDTWNMFLNFAETCDITSYDDTEAWPSLFDDFVEYETDRTNQNLKEDHKDMSGGCSSSGGGGASSAAFNDEENSCVPATRRNVWENQRS